jgi:Cu(I)/Ag(I) efflux system membrane protein CusA/SilA
MIDKIIEYSAKNKFYVFTIIIFLIFLSIYSIKRIPLDAIPDLSDTQVIIYTEWMGFSICSYRYHRKA